MSLGKSDLKLKVDVEPTNHNDAWAGAMNMFKGMMNQKKVNDANDAKVTKLQGDEYGRSMADSMKGVNQNLHLNSPSTAAPVGYVNPDPNFNSMASFTPPAATQNPFNPMTMRNPYDTSINQNPTYFTSDEDEKKDIEPSSKELQKFLDAMGEPKQYKYKDTSLEGTAEGTHISPMAQQMEKSNLSKEYVEDGEDGVKRVAYGNPRMMGLALSALAHLNQKVKKLEK